LTESIRATNAKENKVSISCATVQVVQSFHWLNMYAYRKETHPKIGYRLLNPGISSGVDSILELLGWFTLYYGIIL
jgi:hypothetical protein